MDSSIELWEIGGCVRDELLGVPSKDIDYTCVAPSFEALIEFIESEGLKIVVTTPEFFTIRAVAPKLGFRGHQGGLDFVWAREEGPYSDGRRPDWVKPGTLRMDQDRRDFSMNSIAKAEDGNLIDPHNGQLDIQRRIIRAVGDPLERLLEDPLRALRAIRFAVTKGFNIDPNLRFAMAEPLVVEGVASHVSDERICEELSKMFQKDTVASLLILSDFPALMSAAFSGNVSLDATMKTKGRG